MVAGIALLGTVTATVASWLVEAVAEEDDAETAPRSATARPPATRLRRLVAEPSAAGAPRSSPSCTRCAPRWRVCATRDRSAPAQPLPS